MAHINIYAKPTATADDLSNAAVERTQAQVQYDPSYYHIPYPNGDVPSHIGVCTDVLIRSYRKIGIDLQKLVHEDMKRHFYLYSKRWGLKQPDTHIDHRRVPNLQIFFSRHGTSLPISNNHHSYKPGDIVTWNLLEKGDLPHIGIITHLMAKSGRPLAAHNIGQGTVLEDMLFDYTITGHYRYMR